MIVSIIKPMSWIGFRPQESMNKNATLFRSKTTESVSLSFAVKRESNYSPISRNKSRYGEDDISDGDVDQRGISFLSTGSRQGSTKSDGGENDRRVESQTIEGNICVTE